MLNPWEKMSHRGFAGRLEESALVLIPVTVYAARIQQNLNLSFVFAGFSMKATVCFEDSSTKI
jgi:hypothetical protein